MKYDVSKRGLSEYTNNKIECKTCGHTQATGKRDRVICKHCGNYIYKDDRTEFKYKIMEKQIKERRKYDKFLGEKN
jgi:ribosomal protein S27E